MIVKFAKFFFSTNFIFLPPKKSNLILFDAQSEKIISKIFKLKHFSILCIRKEEINLFVLIKTFLKLQFSFFDYIINYIDYCGAKIVITAVDNNNNFYKIKSRLNVTTIFFQNGVRIGHQDVFSIFHQKKKLNYYRSIYNVDLMCVMNKMTGNLYQKFIQGKVFVAGSVLSNERQILKTRNKDLLYVSLYRINSEAKVKNNTIKLIKTLNQYCIKNHLKLKILGKYYKKNTKEEKNFYDQALGRNIFFIPNSKKRNTYNIIDKAKIIISPGSTAGIESLGRGKKTVLINIKYNVSNFGKKVFFGFYTKRRNLGLFWHNGLNKKAIFKIINKVLSCKKSKWDKILKNYKYETSLYDYKNKRLKKELIKFFKFKNLDTSKYLQ
jgi:surface carbohydrate biosynthesis protein